MKLGSTLKKIQVKDSVVEGMNCRFMRTIFNWYESDYNVLCKERFMWRPDEGYKPMISEATKATAEKARQIRRELEAFLGPANSRIKGTINELRQYERPLEDVDRHIDEYLKESAQVAGSQKREIRPKKELAQRLFTHVYVHLEKDRGSKPAQWEVILEMAHIWQRESKRLDCLPRVSSYDFLVTHLPKSKRSEEFAFGRYVLRECFTDPEHIKNASLLSVKTSLASFLRFLSCLFSQKIFPSNHHIFSKVFRTKTETVKLFNHVKQKPII